MGISHEAALKRPSAAQLAAQNGSLVDGSYLRGRDFLDSSLKSLGHLPIHLSERCRDIETSAMRVKMSR